MHQAKSRGFGGIFGRMATSNMRYIMRIMKRKGWKYDIMMVRIA
jgi:hypothetical protein